MSDAAEPAPKKKGKLKKLLLIGGGALLLAGGGVGAGLYASGAGLGGDHAAEPKEDPNAPKLVLKDGSHEEGHAPKKGKHGEEKLDPAKYQATYYTIENAFTSNLRDSDGFMQVSLGVSTYYDERVIENLKRNELPVRSAVLMTLSDQDSFAVATPEGKKELAKALKVAINEALTTKEGFGGVADVYFTNLIIQ